MKSLHQYLVVLMFIFLPLFSYASPTPYYIIYDTDGLGRISNYDEGPIASIITSSYSARQLSLYIYRKNSIATCDYANVFNIDNGERVADGPVTSADINTSTLSLNLQFKDDDLQKNKLVSLSCHDENGNFFSVEHKVPGAPKVEWTSDLQPKGSWRPAAYTGVGRFDSLKYTAVISVNNNTSEGNCLVSDERGYSIGFFHGQHERKNFYSDYFSTDIEIMPYDPPILLHKITCYNSGGTTTAVQVWQVDENGIKKLDSYVHVD